MPGRGDGISDSLERLLARFAERVRWAGRQYGLQPADVDEVFQETRIRLWRSLASGERIDTASAFYVYRTAASAAVDLIRRRRARHEEPLDGYDGVGSGEPAGTQTVDRDLERREVADRIAEAVESLVDSRRAVVRMWLTGYDLREIMDVFRYSEPKARNLLYRGLADLRARLQEMGIGPEAVS